MFKLVDVDRHVIEPMQMWAHYVDKTIFETSPVYLVEETVEYNGKIIMISEVMIAGLPLIGNSSLALKIAIATLKNNGSHERDCAMHPARQLTTMNASGIETAYLFPTFASYIVNHGAVSSEVSEAYADGYNRWLSDYIAMEPKRLKAVGMISRHEPLSMPRQLERIIHRDWKSVVIRPEVIKGRSLGDPQYHDFYRLCAVNNIAIILHGGTHLYGNTVGSERFDSHFGLHACSHPMELQMAFVSLLGSGVLENNPTLKIGLLEAGCSWVPHWLWRLDNICYPEFPDLIKEQIKKRPSQYFKQHCWVSVEPGEPCINEVIEMIGHKKLIFGTDFPHTDHLDIEPLQLFEPSLGLTREQLRDIFEYNPLDLFEG